MKLEKEILWRCNYYAVVITYKVVKKRAETHFE